MSTLRADLEATVRIWREESEPYPEDGADDRARRGGIGYCASELAAILSVHPAEDAPEADPVRYALVEQMGHRATVASIRETTFCGAPMLEVTDLKTGSVHLVSPQSIYEISWLTEDAARARAKPWTAVALPAAQGYDSWDDRDDTDRMANGEGSDVDETPEAEL